MRTVAGLLGVMMLGPVTGWAQGSCAVLSPGADDALVAAPANHTVLFEDADVRVLDVHSQPRTREAVHTHRLPSVMYTERAGAGTYDSADGTVHRSHETDPDFKPNARAIKPEGPHYTTNTGEVPFHAIRVEFKHPGCGPAGWKAAAPGANDELKVAPASHRVLFEDGDVRVVDVQLAAGAREKKSDEVWPAVVYVAAGGPVEDKAGGATGPVSLKTRSVFAVPAGEHALENDGNEALHLVVFELKYGSDR